MVDDHNEYPEAEDRLLLDAAEPQQQDYELFEKDF